MLNDVVPTLADTPNNTIAKTLKIIVVNALETFLSYETSMLYVQ
jgi:hypothetical protein